MCIATIGSGISGLTAAHHLHPRHDLTVFEADDRVGGHANTVPVNLDDGTWNVDTRFIVVNHPTSRCSSGRGARGRHPTERHVARHHR